MSATDYITSSWKGLDRKENKDDVLVLESENTALFVVFDGVSSTPDARDCIKVVKEHITTNWSLLKKGEVSLSEIFFQANEAAKDAAIPDGASTFVAVLVREDQNSITMSSLGDSRIYAISKSKIEQITSDDSPKNEPHIVTKGLGFENMGAADFNVKGVPFHAKRLLLCTDGVYEFIEKNKTKFTDMCTNKSLDELQKIMAKEIKGNNFDDATYLILELS